jgi:hypothetical protein
MAACSALHSYKKGSGIPFTIYNLYSCGVFHQLMIAVLIGHAQALRKLAALSPSMEDLDADVTDSFEGVLVWTKLLWYLVRSRAFQVHLAVLAKAKLLERLRNGDYLEAEDFAEERELGCSHGGTGDQALEGEAGDVEPSVAEIALWDVDVTFRKLVAMAVTYVGAADILERYCVKSRKHPTIFQASFIALKQPEGKVTWTGIEHAMESLSFQQEHITALKGAIDARSYVMSPIFQNITTLKNTGSTPWTAVYHCQAILAILLIGGVIEGGLNSDFCFKV